VVLALDSVTDPGNLGAIVRSAVFFGAAGVVLSEHDCAAVNAAVVRRSAGAVFKCRVARVPNLSRALARMKEAGFWVYGTFPAEGRPLPEVRFEAKSVVVLGAEGKGVRPGVRKQCDFPITLAGGFESLNVAAFASVVLYAFRDGEAGGPAR
jgi:23S rRNA (guanosine2251-2'-O)-methyltransferase